MNAAAAAGNGGDELDRLRGDVADLQAQRALLITEMSELREARNQALKAAAQAQQEVTRLQARIQELENP